MTLIEELKIDNLNVRFYDGIDFEMIKNHRGNDYLIFFIKSWKCEIKKWERDIKLNKILYDKENNEFDVHNMSNDFISIYQVGDDLFSIVDVVKKRIINSKSLSVFPWKIGEVV